MSTLRAIKKLLLGENWILPMGVATILAAGATIRPMAAGAWPHIGGPILVVGVVAVLLASVITTARRR